SDYYGPGGAGSAAGEHVFGAAVRGKTVSWPASLDQPHTFHFLGDIARGLVTLGTDAAADGQAWVLPAAGPLTAREFFGLVFDAAGRSPRARAMSKPMARAVGLFVPPVRELPDIWYQTAAPFVIDATRFQATFGPSPVTPHPEAIRQTVAWFRDHGTPKTA
ncbi:MAG: NAD-dependent dehydratase, partial [Chloroflexia bacterium]|nr:NAD-dependent dehydratase [Chloroflexia bacterium]